MPAPVFRDLRKFLFSRALVLRIVLAYAVFAALWVVLSGKAAELVLGDAAWSLPANTLTGGLFVLFTSVLLYAVLMRVRRYTSNAAQVGSRQGGSRPVLPWPLLLLWCGIIVAAGGGIRHSYMYSRHEEMQRLDAIAVMKSHQIADWLRERRGDADLLLGTPYLVSTYLRWQNNGDQASRSQLLGRLERLRRIRGYESFSLVNPQLQNVAGSALAPALLADAAQAGVRRAIAERRVQRIGPYQDAAGRVLLDYAIPLFDGANPAVVVLLHINTQDWLQRILHNWPQPSRTAEADLFRRQGDDFVFLSALRFLPDRTLRVRLPVKGDNVLADWAARPQSGSLVFLAGTDYRRVPVVGMIRPVDGTDWYLLVKQDNDEVFAAAAHDAIWIGLTGLLSIFTVGALFYLLRQRQQLDMAARISEEQEARLQALQLLSAIAESSTDAIFAEDLEGRCILINQAAGRYIGKPEAEVLGTDVKRFFAGEQADHLAAESRRVIAEGKIETAEDELDTAVGRRTFLSTRGPLRGSNGRLIGVFGIARDITERKQTELAIQQSERRFHDIANASADWIWEVDAGGRFTFASDSVTELLGYTPAEIVGRTPFELMPEEEVRRVAEKFAAHVARREPFHDLENINRHKDGSLRYILTNGVPILAENGALLGYRGLDRDVTAMKKSEQTLRESEARFRTLFDNAAVAIRIHDPADGQVLAANRRAIEDCGCRTLEEMASLELWLDFPYSAAEFAAFVRLAAADKPQRFEWKSRNLAGKTYWQEVLLNRIEINGADRVLSSSIDITRRKAAVDALHHQAEELRQRNEELERFNRASVGREMDMITLKRLVNALSIELGREPPFSLDFLDAATGKMPKRQNET